MNVHEYQAKALLAEFGVAVPKGGVAYTPDEAAKVAGELGGPVWVVKAQIHAGGRGMGGGVKLAKSVDEVRGHAGAQGGKGLGGCLGQRPPAVPIDADRQDLVTTGVDGFEHMAGRHARHLVLGAAAAEEHDQEASGLRLLHILPHVLHGRIVGSVRVLPGAPSGHRPGGGRGRVAPRGGRGL